MSARIPGRHHESGRKASAAARAQVHEYEADDDRGHGGDVGVRDDAVRGGPSALPRAVDGDALRDSSQLFRITSANCVDLAS